MKYKNVTILGTSHIARESIREVERLVNEDKPSIIALELDKKRLYALTHPQKKRIRLTDIRRVGLKGYIFSLIGGYVEKKLGEVVKVTPGAEMKRAFQLAQKEKIKVALIDQEIEVTLKKFSKSLSWKEKWNFLVDIFKAVVLRKKEINIDLTKVPTDKVIEILIKKVKDRYPNVYRVLIADRNTILAQKLAKVMFENPDSKILALVGAGHKKKVIVLLKKFHAVLQKQNAYIVTYE